MNKIELFQKIVQELEESKAPHICCFVDKKALTFSVRCSETDFYNFLYATCKNIPWAKEVIKDFVEDIDTIEKNEVKEIDDTYLN